MYYNSSSRLLSLHLHGIQRNGIFLCDLTELPHGTSLLQTINYKIEKWLVNLSKI